jgi:hypothetical protein
MLQLDQRQTPPEAVQHCLQRKQLQASEYRHSHHMKAPIFSNTVANVAVFLSTTCGYYLYNEIHVWHVICYFNISKLVQGKCN